MTIDTEKLREHAGNLKPPHLDVAIMLLGAADAYDAQAAEIAEAKGQIEHLDQQNDGLRRACAALEAEKTRLRYALRWSAAALQEACRRPTIITEKDLWRIGDETRTTEENPMADRYADLRAALDDGWVQSIHPDTVRALLAERDALREALWVATEHNALHFGDSHSTVIQGRAALAQGQEES